MEGGKISTAFTVTRMYLNSGLNDVGIEKFFALTI